MSTKPMQAGAAKLGAHIQNELLEQRNDIETALGPARFTLQLLIKSISGFVLANDPSGIALIGDIQCRLDDWLKKIDSVLPRQSKEMSLREATPTLVTILDEVPAMIDDLKRLEKYLSPLAMWS
ncbi:hypothetical protein R69658_02546 [Paraburkholderia aspalathi]|uniref:Uncharacterized protein n=1 Tax=Paraburkholderia aspalathi TaxID=1324617 RepID=A0ABN7LHH1_9BURK|nr:hypothetical protein [Paraburkholderia aspalathi]MBK3817810.1 hypothetical protein [Paraburkholderia aspalathi]MBK3829574.1 hypothetical protein [Paraburkholderia aspalathi]MBK3859394.1 hypothetical protein [Paraburkholderia aspalathi]CAE6747254.1 hypothetical protein R69658_02546 [Paraburkholderia aspalathi]